MKSEIPKQVGLFKVAGMVPVSQFKTILGYSKSKESK